MWALIFASSTCAKMSKRVERHGAHYKIYVGGKKHFTTVYKRFNEYGKENCKLDF